MDSWGFTLKYKNELLTEDCLLVGIEAGSPDLLYQYVGKDGLVFGIADFGLSAPSEQVYAHFGLTAKKITKKILAKL